MRWRASRSRSSLVRPRTLSHLWPSQPPEGTPLPAGLGSCCVSNGRRHPLAGVIVDNDDMATGMEKKEIDGSTDIFWSREPIMGHRGTKENPAIVPSFNTSRVVGLETEQARRPTGCRQRPAVTRRVRSQPADRLPASAAAGCHLVQARQGPAAPRRGSIFQAGAVGRRRALSRHM